MRLRPYPFREALTEKQKQDPKERIMNSLSAALVKKYSRPVGRKPVTI